MGRGCQGMGAYGEQTLPDRLGLQNKIGLIRITNAK